LARKALGRGLAALLPESDLPNGQQLAEIHIDSIEPNLHQPRQQFDDAALAELAQSIREHGIVQPVIVTRDQDRYRLVVGERRWRAARMAGLPSIPALVNELSEAQQTELALVENLQREDLNPVEEALAYQQLMDLHGWTQDKVAARIGKSRPAVANAIRLLKLPGEIIADLRSGAVSAGHARAILALDTRAQQQQLWRLIKSRDLSVRQAERIARRIKEGKIAVSRGTSAQDPDWVEVAEEMQRFLGAKVRIRPRGKRAGRIEIYYSSMEELERLVDMFQDQRPEARYQDINVSLL